jgi:high-affinity Fe2+/Pb2+ permease
MLFDQATDTQMQAVRILGGVTVVAFLAARMFRRQGQRIRIAIAGLYFAGVLGFVVYALF